MKKTLWALFLLWASSAVKGLQATQGDHMELTRLKMSLMYVRSIKTFRLLFVSLLGMGVCLILLLAGIILFYVSVFLYAPWSVETKMWIGLLSSIICLWASVSVFSRIFAADKWLEIFHAKGIMAYLNKENSSPIQKESEEAVQQR